MTEPPVLTPEIPTAPPASGPLSDGSAPASAPATSTETKPEAEAVRLAPADLAPAPRGWERLAWYSGTMLLAAVLATCGMQLWDRDLRAPFYYDLDSLLYLPMVRTVIEKGSHWENERLGAPGVQQLYDFPVIDHLHFACLWLLGRVFSDALLVYNAYSLLNYPLTALTAMWVMRWLKLSLPAAALGGLLYAFLPYHQERYHYHYFLAAYWWVPVSLVPAIAICRGDFPYFRRTPGGGYFPLEIDWRKVRTTASGAARAKWAAWKTLFAWSGRVFVWLLRNLFTRRALVPILMGVVTASAGAYYAFFACAAYGFAGLYGWVVHRTWRAAASAALVIAPIVVTGFAYHLPTYIHHIKYGRNPITERQAHEADHYGLKIAHLLLPTNDHNWRWLAGLRLKYAASLRPAEGESAGSLGVIGGAGFLALVAIALLPFRKRWPEGPIAALTVFLVLLASIGAFGSLFNLLVMAHIRAYNRISVFIAFLCLFAALWWIDRFLLTRTGRITRRLRYPALGALLLIGYLDQTPWGWNPLNAQGMSDIDKFAERFQADRRFFKEIENTMPPGSRVFCLPYSAFPESPPVHKMGCYEHARGYVMTDALYWSFGAMKRREADEWQLDVSSLMFRAPELMLKRIVASGFDGLLIDGRGFPPARGVDHAAALIARLNELYQAEAWPERGRLPAVVHEDRRQFFIDLRPFRRAWSERKPAEFAAMEVHEREWVASLWLAGFLSLGPDDAGERTIWGAKDATLRLVNPTDRTREFLVSFVAVIDTTGPFVITFSGLIDDSFTLERESDSDPRRWKAVRYVVQLPPGHSTVRIRCETPEHFVGEAESLCYFIRDFKLTEIHR